MIDIKNVLEVVNEVLVLPIAIISFFLLTYIAVYLWTKDPDVIRSRIFLKYDDIKKAFVLLEIFAFVLVIHVSLIYIPHFYLVNYFFIDNLQRIFGLILVFILIAFVYIIFGVIRNSNSELIK